MNLTALSQKAKATQAEEAEGTETTSVHSSFIAPGDLLNHFLNFYLPVMAKKNNTSPAEKKVVTKIAATDKVTYKPFNDDKVTYKPFNDDKQLSGPTGATIVFVNKDGSVNLEMTATDGSIIQRHSVEAGPGFNQYK